ncbi:46243_t:CDS:1, partial [Gigaspora margarita]
ISMQYELDEHSVVRKLYEYELLKAVFPAPKSPYKSKKVFGLRVNT